MSCQSCPEQIEPVKLDLDFPVFPTPEGVTLSDNIVSMPLNYWLQITDYAIDVDAVKQKYNLMK